MLMNLLFHPRDLRVRGSNLTRGSQPAKLPLFGGYSLKNLKPYELVSTRRALEKNFAANHHQDQERGTASHPPDPHRLLWFSLLVEESYRA